MMLSTIGLVTVTWKSPVMSLLIFFIFHARELTYMILISKTLNIMKMSLPTTVSHLLHSDDNPFLAKNEEVKYYTLITQVLPKIVFYSLLPKSGDYCHTRRCAPLLIYCLLKGIRVNILRLIVNYMVSENLLIPSRNISFEMMITHFLRYFNINLSFETAFAPSVNIYRIFLKILMSVPMFFKHLLLNLILGLPLHLSKSWWIRWILLSLVHSPFWRKFSLTKWNFRITSLIFARPYVISNSAMTSLSPSKSGLFLCLMAMLSLYPL